MICLSCFYPSTKCFLNNNNHLVFSLDPLSSTYSMHMNKLNGFCRDLHATVIVSTTFL
jgi:hypothetical protein